MTLVKYVFFLNTNAEFDSQNFRDQYEAKGIIANLAENKRNRNNEND